jgi:N-acetylneuraminic acid mutarotase
LTADVLATHLSAPLSRAVAVPDGRGGILVAGGLTAAKASATVIDRFDPTGPTITGAGRLRTGVHDTAAALIGERLVVFGGGTATGETATVQAAGSDATSDAIGQLPSARSDHGAVGLGDGQGRVAVVGGFDGNSPSLDVLTTVDGVTYTTLGRLAEPVRYAAVAADATTLYVIGGEWNGQYSSAVQAIDVQTGATRVISQLPEPLGHASVFSLDGAIYLAGGRGPNGYTDRIGRLDPATGAVVTVGHLPAAESDGPAAVAGDTAYIFGGEHNGTLDTIVALRRAP